MERYKRFQEGSYTNFNSEFDGYVIENVNSRIAPKVETILINNNIIYDKIKDMNYYQFITTIEDPKDLQDVIEEIKDRTGQLFYIDKRNKGK